MSYVLGVLMAAALFAVFGLFWRDPDRDHRQSHRSGGQDGCETCPLAGSPPPARHLRIVR